MTFAARQIATALALLTLLFVCDARAQLVLAIAEDDEAGTARITAEPETISFGTVEVGTVSRTVSITLLNFDEGVAVVNSISAGGDAAVGYPVAGPDFPVTLAPGEEMIIQLAYANSDKTTTQTGEITVFYVSTLGDEELIIPFTARCVPEGGAPTKPDEGWFLGPCFLDTLTHR